MKEILKAAGKELIEKTKGKIEQLRQKAGEMNIKPKIKIPKTLFQTDITLAEKIQLSFQVKRPAKTEKKADE